ncbi:MAG: hypothetical protein CMF89_00650 [Candidatus Marinimicrobia bacterium]|nr:hypothetical protein [Candidatus Neomarinimicrobiota bacterium]MAV92669.1 hypothetical protein [Candidatus Neomarinimicrobiota bacterium]MBS29900.1 hypothetical protein [Candidatus Neomarinimicrobiota bacterium]
MVAIFVAGPDIKKTKTAPIEKPDECKANAIGTDAVAQTYVGRPKINIINIPKIPEPTISK